MVYFTEAVYWDNKYCLQTKVEAQPGKLLIIIFEWVMLKTNYYPTRSGLKLCLQINFVIVFQNQLVLNYLMSMEKSGKLLKQFKIAYSISLTHGLIRGLPRTINKIITVSTVYKLIHNGLNELKQWSRDIYSILYRKIFPFNIAMKD